MVEVKVSFKLSFMPQKPLCYSIMDAYMDYGIFSSLLKEAACGSDTNIFKVSTNNYVI